MRGSRAAWRVLQGAQAHPPPVALIPSAAPFTRGWLWRAVGVSACFRGRMRRGTGDLEEGSPHGMLCLNINHKLGQRGEQPSPHGDRLGCPCVAATGYCHLCVAGSCQQCLLNFTHCNHFMTLSYCRKNVSLRRLYKLGIFSPHFQIPCIKIRVQMRVPIKWQDIQDSGATFPAIFVATSITLGLCVKQSGIHLTSHV